MTLFLVLTCNFVYSGLWDVASIAENLLISGEFDISSTRLFGAAAVFQPTGPYIWALGHNSVKRHRELPGEDWVEWYVLLLQHSTNVSVHERPKISRCNAKAKAKSHSSTAPSMLTGLTQLPKHHIPPPPSPPPPSALHAPNPACITISQLIHLQHALFHVPTSDLQFCPVSRVEFEE